MATQEYTHLLIDPQFKMPKMHFHHEHELYYLIKGHVTFFVGNEIIHLEENGVLFIPEGILHRSDYTASQYAERIVIPIEDSIFTEELLKIRKELFHRKVTYITKNKIPFLHNLMFQIEAEYERNDNYSDFMVRHHLAELFVLLHRYKYDYHPTLSDTDKAMFQISQYISAHYQNHLPLEELSQRFGISKSHLSRKFKEFAGIGINEYITHVRITNAERLLNETTLSITQISEQCGFHDSNYFSTVFKKTKGIPPRKYPRP